jgi:YidC/Oxa1 family membrane protein insertase
MLNILLVIYSVIGNFGLAIILFTILIRLITHPLTVKQMKSSAGMQELQKVQAVAGYSKEAQR